MSLWIEVYVGRRDNRKKVAECHAYNISDLKSISDYEFESVEYGEPRLSIYPSEVKGEVEGHDRNQSVWALVEKIARKSKPMNAALERLSKR
jgi:hypothetical protein